MTTAAITSTSDILVLQNGATTNGLARGGNGPVGSGGGGLGAGGGVYVGAYQTLTLTNNY